LLAALGLISPMAVAAECPGNPDALGTERVLAVDSAVTPRVGRKSFPTTLPLGPKEVVLTFDDGPNPGTTERVLEALKRECVRATFFLIGKHAESHPGLVKRTFAEGHTIGNHTYSHPWLSQIMPQRAQAEIDRGFAAIQTALGPSHKMAPFFRFPGFTATEALLDNLEKRQIPVFGADLWASDWNPMTPAETMNLTLRRLMATDGGILLFHDTQPHTAAMLPEFLRELKRRGFRIVHIVPAHTAIKLNSAAH
jgi:peptidoglycan/xylan/chitin deacetylase (PgdA/CDA1 family)